MSTPNNGTSLLQQKDKINQKYGGDINAYDFEASYVGDANAKKKAYADYMADKNFVSYIDGLEQNKTDAINQAKRNESQKLQYADTRRQLMQKYIPETLLAQGIANTGYTADALLKAENNYNQYAIGAMNDRANTEQDIMKQYQDSYNEYKKEYDEKAYERFLGEQDRIAQEENDKKTLYANGIDLVNSGTYDKPQLEKWLEVNGLKKGDEIYDKVVAYYDDEVKRNIEAINEAKEKEGIVYNNVASGLKLKGGWAGEYESRRMDKHDWKDKVKFEDAEGATYKLTLKKTSQPDDVQKAIRETAGTTTAEQNDRIVMYKDKLYYIDQQGYVRDIVKGNDYTTIMTKMQNLAGKIADNKESAE